jgi:hypothetical protein
MTANTRTFSRSFGQIPEPPAIQFEERSYEIPEPFQLGELLDAGTILEDNRRLWRIETYADRHGKRRARRVLRFVTRPEPKIELGQINEATARELEDRPGRGRWRDSRVEADELRCIALNVAERFKQDPLIRRRG